MKIELKSFFPEIGLEEWREAWGWEKDIPYVSEGEEDAYRRERCKLDVFRPMDGRTGMPVLVHFHGGGFTGGTKGLNPVLQLLGCVQFSVEYRLAPKAGCPTWFQDGAAAIAWVLKNAERFGGDPSNVFVYGESAGACLTSLLAADTRYLAAEGVGVEEVRGFISLSGEMMTHFLIREGHGIPNFQPAIDEFAPLHYVRKDFPPFLMLTGGTGREIDCRPAENKLMQDLLVFAGNSSSECYELPHLTHGNVWYAVLPYMREFIAKWLRR